MNPNGPKETTEKGNMITQDEIIKAEDAAEETLERVETMAVPETSALRAALMETQVCCGFTRAEIDELAHELTNIILAPEVLKEALMPYWQELRRRGEANHYPIITIKCQGREPELVFSACADVLQEWSHGDTVEAAMAGAKPQAAMARKLAELEEEARNIRESLAQLEGGAK